MSPSSTPESPLFNVDGFTAAPLRISIISTTTDIAWETAGEFTDIRYEKAEGIARITIDRPEARNAFRPWLSLRCTISHLPRADILSIPIHQEEPRMDKLEKLENEVRTLSAEELAEFREWFRKFDAEAWDRQIESDALAGKLDALADEALSSHRAGKSTHL